MNAARLLLAWFAFSVGAVGLWAQDPVLQLERRFTADGNSWTGRTALAFRVTVLHPAMRKGAGGGDADFVLDPPGGWRGAIRLLVTDAAGKPVDWPFENMGKAIDQPLSLYRLGTASASFLLEPKAGGAAFPLGRYQVRARLASTTGKWRGSVDSQPVVVEVVGRTQPGLQLVGADEGPLLRGWPILIGVKLTAPDGYDGGLTLPTEEKDWTNAISLTLSDKTDAPVALPIERLPFSRDELSKSQLNARDGRTIWFRVAAEATRSLGDGPYRWTAKFSLPASNRAQSRWTGSVSAMSAAISVVAPAMPLSAELARRQTTAQVEDLLVEAKLLRERAEGGYMNDRTMAAQQAAGPLLRAERLALQWLDAHPDDPSGAVLVANVMAAQEDKFRAIAYTRRAIEADLHQRAPSGGAAAEPSLTLQMMVIGFEAMPDELHPVLTPALRAALKEARSGKTPSPPSPTTNPAQPTPTTSSPPTSAPAPTTPVPTKAITPPVAPVAPTRAGGPTLGEIVPAGELVDAKIRADAAGQWAASASAGSQYDRKQYSAAQATGAPNINVQGNSPDAWCPASRDQGTDWLEVTFTKPVRATEIRVRQNDAAGALTKIEAIEPDGTTHLWWEGADPYKAPAVREIVWFGVRVPKTPYLVARVKLTLNLASGPGYKEIDAVQLVAASADEK